MNLGIKNKNVLITGASQNIGKSIAINMAREGCNIAICARNKEKLYDVVSEMKQYGGGYHSINIDLRSKKGPSQLIKELGLSLINGIILGLLTIARILQRRICRCLAI